mmetsp:Transcript_152973/g.285041  ORF Transcript_152973/g.285041 Transcript_152973/m.285041 type:complete len:218 (-) Transcript_152973:128-781(-)
MSSSGSGKTVFSPRIDLTFPVTLSIKRMYSYALSTNAFLTPGSLAVAPSTFHVGSRNIKALPFCTQRLPLPISFSLMYSSSCNGIARMTADDLSYGFGNHTQGPFVIFCSPVSLSSTKMYSVGLRLIPEPRSPCSCGPGNQTQGPFCTRFSPVNLSSISTNSVLLRLRPAPFSPDSHAVGNHVHGPLSIRLSPLCLSTMSTYSVLLRLSAMPLAAFS